jgi:hypothetical protein
MEKCIRDVEEIESSHKYTNQVLQKSIVLIFYNMPTMIRSQMMALKSRFKAWRESAYESIATASTYTSLSATNRQNVFKLFVWWRQAIAQLWS